MQEELAALVQLLTKEREKYKHDEELHQLERDTLIRECTDLKDAMKTSTSTINQMKLEFQGKIGDQPRRIEFLSSFTKQPRELGKENTTSLTSISSPIRKLLDNYDLLDEDSKKGLFQMAMTTQNEHLQQAIIQL
jgi:DnaJ-domain-containing protein 1